MSYSCLNNLLNVFVAPPAYLKYSLVENLFLSNESVKLSAELLIVVRPAENFPVAFTEFIRLLCRFACAFAAAELVFEVILVVQVLERHQD